jgi:hypothetical protein
MSRIRRLIPLVQVLVIVGSSTMLSGGLYLLSRALYHAGIPWVSAALYCAGIGALMFGLWIGVGFFRAYAPRLFADPYDENDTIRSINKMLVEERQPREKNTGC